VSGPIDPSLLGPLAPTRESAPVAPGRTPSPGGPAFNVVLASKTAGVQFSGHAMQRVERRGIDLGAQTLERLQQGVDRAAQKGARDSVVLVDGTAFVVSVRNRTVITAVDPGHMRDHVFTNIDSAVIA
jgi:flagellar operon protein